MGSDSKLEGVRLGHKPDEEIAKEQGVSRESVRVERVKRGIPAFKGESLRGSHVAEQRASPRKVRCLTCCRLVRAKKGDVCSNHYVSLSHKKRVLCDGVGRVGKYEPKPEEA